MNNSLKKIVLLTALPSLLLTSVAPAAGATWNGGPWSYAEPQQKTGEEQKTARYILENFEKLLKSTEEEPYGTLPNVTMANRIVGEVTKAFPGYELDFKDLSYNKVKEMPTMWFGGAERQVVLLQQQLRPTKNWADRQEITLTTLWIMPKPGYADFAIPLTAQGQVWIDNQALLNPGDWRRWEARWTDGYEKLNGNEDTLVGVMEVKRNSGENSVLPITFIKARGAKKVEPSSYAEPQEKAGEEQKTARYILENFEKLLKSTEEEPYGTLPNVTMANRIVGEVTKAFPGYALDFKDLSYNKVKEMPTMWFGGAERQVVLLQQQLRPTKNWADRQEITLTTLWIMPKPGYADFAIPLTAQGQVWIDNQALLNPGDWRRWEARWTDGYQKLSGNEDSLVGVMEVKRNSGENSVLPITFIKARGAKRVEPVTPAPPVATPEAPIEQFKKREKVERVAPAPPMTTEEAFIQQAEDRILQPEKLWRNTVAWQLVQPLRTPGAPNDAAAAADFYIDFSQKPGIEILGGFTKDKKKHTLVALDQHAVHYGETGGPKRGMTRTFWALPRDVKETPQLMLIPPARAGSGNTLKDATERVKNVARAIQKHGEKGKVFKHPAPESSHGIAILVKPEENHTYTPSLVAHNEEWKDSLELYDWYFDQESWINNRK